MDKTEELQGVNGMTCEVRFKGDIGAQLVFIDAASIVITPCQPSRSYHPH